MASAVRDIDVTFGDALAASGYHRVTSVGGVGVNLAPDRAGGAFLWFTCKGPLAPLTDLAVLHDGEHAADGVARVEKEVSGRATLGTWLGVARSAEPAALVVAEIAVGGATAPDPAPLAKWQRCVVPVYDSATAPLYVWYRLADRESCADGRGGGAAEGKSGAADGKPWSLDDVRAGDLIDVFDNYGTWCQARALSVTASDVVVEYRAGAARVSLPRAATERFARRGTKTPGGAASWSRRIQGEELWNVPDEQLRDVHARVVRLAAVQALSSDDLEFINTQLHTVVDTALSSRTSVAAVMSIQQLLASVIELFFTRVIQPYPLPPALIGIVHQIWGGDPGADFFYRSHVGDPDGYCLNPYDVAVCTARESVWLVSNVNTFARLLGFDALSLRITGCDASADADDARDVEVPYGDRVSASDAAAYLVTGTADGTDGSAAWTGADATFRVPRPNEIALVAGAVQAACKVMLPSKALQIARRWLRGAFTHLLRVDDSTLKSGDTNAVLEAFDAVASLARAVGVPDVPERTEKFWFRYSLRLLACPVIAVKLKGMATLVELALKTSAHERNLSTTQYWAVREPATVWMRPKWLADSIVEAGVFDRHVLPDVGRGMPHPELLQHSSPLIKFLTAQGKLEPTLLDRFWLAGVAESSQIEVVAGAFDCLSKITPLLSPSDRSDFVTRCACSAAVRTPFLHGVRVRRASVLELARYSVPLVNFIAGLGGEKYLHSSDREPVALVLWNAHLGLPGNPVGGACSDALLKLIDAMYYAESKAGLVRSFAHLAIEKLRGGADGPSSVAVLFMTRRLMDLLHNYEKIETAKQLISRDDVLSVVVASVSRSKLASKAVSGASAGPGSDPHADIVKAHLDFLTFVLVTAPSWLLPFDTVKILWDSCVVGALSAEETEALFSWLSTGIEKAFIAPLIQDRIFADLLCQNRGPDVARYGIAGMRCFQAYFVARNLRTYGLRRKYGALPADDTFETGLLRDLEGVATLWDMALQSVDVTLSTEASKFLISLHTRQLMESVSRYTVWSSFVDHCMGEIRGEPAAVVAGSGAAAVLSVLRLLAAFVEAVHEMAPLYSRAAPATAYTPVPVGKKVLCLRCVKDPPGAGFSNCPTIHVDVDALLGEVRTTTAQALKCRPDLLRLRGSQRGEALVVDLDQHVSMVDAGIYYDVWYEVLTRPAVDTKGAAGRPAPPEPSATAGVPGVVWNGSAAGWAARKEFTFSDERAQLLRHLAEGAHRATLMDLAAAVDSCTRDEKVAALQHHLWLVVRLLPANAEMARQFQEITADDIGMLDWDRLLSLHRGIALLQRLLLVEELLVANRPEWLMNFGVAGGFARLYSILVDGDEVVRDHTVAHACFSVLCRAVHAGVVAARDTMSVDAVGSVRSIVRQLREVVQCAATDACPVDDGALYPVEAEAVRWSLQLLMALASMAREALPAVLVELQSTDGGSGIDVLAAAIVLRAKLERVRTAGVDGVFAFCTHEVLEAASCSGKTGMPACVLATMLAMVNDTYLYADSCQQFYALMALLVTHCMGRGTMLATDVCLTLVRHLRRHPSLEVTSNDSDFVLRGLLSCAAAIFAPAAAGGRIGARPVVSRSHSFDDVEGEQGILLRSEAAALADHLWTDGLFAETVDADERSGGAGLPLCKSAKTRKEAFKLLVMLASKSMSVFVRVVGLCSENHSLEEMGADMGARGNFDLAGDDQAKSAAGFVGLKNLGQTCYMNASLQLLFRVDEFKRDILQLNHGNGAGADGGGADSMLFQLQRLFAHLHCSEEQYYDPTPFCGSFLDWEGNPIRTNVQQDASEFLTIFFSSVEAKLSGTKEGDIMKRMFGGMEKQVLLAGPGFRSERSTPFFFISVRVAGMETLTTALANFVSTETLNHTWEVPAAVSGAAAGDKPEKRLLPTKKWMSLEKLPPYLIIHLKRFEYSVAAQQHVKLNDYLEFPERLDVREFTSPAVDGAMAAESRDGTGSGVAAAAVAGFDDSARSGGGAAISSADTQYQLTGVVIHVGTAAGGHYYSLVRTTDEREGSWVQLNDRIVSAFDAASLRAVAFGCKAAEEAKGADEHNENAVLLLYAHVSSGDQPSAASLRRGAVPGADVTGAGGAVALSPAVTERITKFRDLRRRNAIISMMLPAQLQQELHLKNRAFTRRRNILDPEYLEFLLRLAQLYLDPGMFVNEVEEMPGADTDVDTALARIQFVTRVTFATVARHNNKAMLGRWCAQLSSMLERHAQGSAWLMSQFVAIPDMLRDYLLRCPAQEVRASTKAVLMTALSATRGRLRRTCCDLLLRAVVALLPTVSKSDSNSELFELIESAGRLGAEERAVLVAAGVVGATCAMVVGDVACAKARVSSGTVSRPTAAPVAAVQGYAAYSMLETMLSPMEGEARGAGAASHELESVMTDDFLTAVATCALGGHVGATRLVLAMAADSRPVSDKLLTFVSLSMESRDGADLVSVFNFAADVIRLEDSLTEWRTDAMLDSVMNTLIVSSDYTCATETTVDHILTWIERFPLVAVAAAKRTDWTSLYDMFRRMQCFPSSYSLWKPASCYRTAVLAHGKLAMEDELYRLSRAQPAEGGAPATNSFAVAHDGATGAAGAGRAAQPAGGREAPRGVPRGTNLVGRHALVIGMSGIRRAKIVEYRTVTDEHKLVFTDTGEEKWTHLEGAQVALRWELESEPRMGAGIQ